MRIFLEKERIQINVQEKEERRIDQYLAEHTDFSRSYVQKLIKNEKVLINGKFINKVKLPVSFGDIIEIEIPEAKELTIQPEQMDLDILYEDNDVIVVNKPKNLVVHPAPGHMSHTLVNGLLYHCKGALSGINGVMRPGIVHRIDKDTTGALIICKNDMAHQSLAEQLQVHSIHRKYQAIVHNNFVEDFGTIQTNIGRHPIDRKKMAVVGDGKGKKAITHYRVLDHLNNKYNHIECVLETGRTHQIRVHMSYKHHPLLGDKVYGPTLTKPFQNLQGQTLHAKILGFKHPRTNQYIEVEAPLPPYFVQLINELKK